MIIGVTGANGYLGNNLVKYIEAHGHTVYSFSRRPDTHSGGFEFQYSLEKGISKDILAELDVLIHCAYDFTLLRWDDILKTNVDGPNKLFDDAHEAGVKKLIFISTMSSYESCKSNYGRAKQLIEKHIWRYQPVIIKPGLIYGEKAKGMVGALRKAIISLPIIPVVGGKKILYLVHEKDLCEIIYKCATIENKESIEIIAAHKQGRTFKEILELFAHTLKKKRLFFPIPFYLVYSLLRTAEKLHINTGFRSDSLISLYNQNSNPDFTSLDTMKLSAGDIFAEL